MTGGTETLANFKTVLHLDYHLMLRTLLVHLKLQRRQAAELRRSLCTRLCQGRRATMYLSSIRTLLKFTNFNSRGVISLLKANIA